MVKTIDFRHSTITGSLCELVRTLDFELTLGDEMWPIRIEIYRGIADSSWFRCRVWQAENYRIQSTFPMDSRGTPKHHPSDELILVDWSTYLSVNVDWFQASTVEEATEEILTSIMGFVERTTGEEQSE